jgi:hypothetical protein
MQLDERVDAAHQLVVRPDQPRLEPRSGQGIRIRNTTVVRQHPCSARVDCADQELAAETRQAEPGTFLLNKDHNSNRPHRRDTPFSKQVYSSESRNNAQRPVERPTVWDRIQMTAGNNRVAARGLPRVVRVPPSPNISVLVWRDIEPASRCLVDEPQPAFRVGLSPGVATVTTARSANGF